MYPGQLTCFRQMLRFVNKLRCMPDTTLARMALCDAIADYRNHQHNNWFAQLLSFCDKIQAPLPLDLGGEHAIPSFNEADCIARLKAMYHSVFTSAGINHPKIHKYHVCFASQLPPNNKHWEAQPYLCTALNTKQASLIARFRLSDPITWQVKLARGGAEMAHWQTLPSARGVVLKITLWFKMNNTCYSHANILNTCVSRNPGYLTWVGNPHYGGYSTSTTLHMRILHGSFRKPS